MTKLCDISTGVLWHDNYIETLHWDSASEASDYVRQAMNTRGALGWRAFCNGIVLAPEIFNVLIERETQRVRMQ